MKSGNIAFLTITTFKIVKLSSLNYHKFLVYCVIFLFIFCVVNGIKMEMLAQVAAHDFFAATNRVEAWGRVIKNLKIFSIGFCAREPWQIILVHRTLANKTRQDVLRSSTVRYRPTIPSQTCLHYPPADKWTSFVGRQKIGQCAAAFRELSQFNKQLCYKFTCQWHSRQCWNVVYYFR